MTKHKHVDFKQFAFYLYMNESIFHLFVITCMYKIVKLKLSNAGITCVKSRPNDFLILLCCFYSWPGCNFTLIKDNIFGKQILLLHWGNRCNKITGAMSNSLPCVVTWYLQQYLALIDDVNASLLAKLFFLRKLTSVRGCQTHRTESSLCWPSFLYISLQSFDL